MEDSQVPDSRAALLRAASEVLSESGADSLRLREIAERADVTTMGVYTHFGSKNGVVEALYVQGFEDLAVRLADASSGRVGIDAVRAIGAEYREFAVSNPELYGVMFERAAASFVPTPDGRAVSLKSFEVLVRAVAQWKPNSQSDAVAYLILCTSQGLIASELTHIRWGGRVMDGLRGRDGKTIFADSFELLLAGLDA